MVAIRRFRRRHRSPQQLRDLLTGLLFAAPGIAGLLIFVAYPVAASVYFSFTSYNVLQPPRWVGLENYRTLLMDDPLFYKTVFNTLYIAVFTIPLSVIIALGLAMLLNLKVRGQAFYRTLFYLPTLVPFVASSILWTWIYNPQYGLFNTLLGYVGIQGPGWLSDPAWSKPALIIMSLWAAGGWMVIYLAGLQDVPQELYEAAELDGAHWWAKLFFVTIPFMSPYILLSVIIMLIGIFQYFGPVAVMTNGGPVDSSRVYALYLYQNAFAYFKMGYASAMAWLLFIVVVVLTVIIFRSSARRVYYAGQEGSAMMRASDARPDRIGHPPDRRVSNRKLVQSLLSHAVLIVLSLIFTAPFLWLVSTSLKPDEQIFKIPPVWLPHPATFNNYWEGLTFIPYWLYLKNTLIYSVLSTVGTILSSSLVGYSLACIRWYGRSLLFVMIIAMMILPNQVTLIPEFLLFKQLGWIDSLKPLIVPHFFGGPFYIFLLRQFFLTIPRELGEAAKLDGASEWQIYRNIVMPLAKPALTTVGLFTFLYTWNDYLGPLVYLNSPETYTLSIGLVMFQGQHSSYWGQLMAVSTVTTIPTIILYFVTQRTFIQGITLAGTRG